MKYEPDFSILVDAAFNRQVPYVPLYEHNICYGFFDAALGKSISSLFEGDLEDKKEFFRRYSQFLASHGYDAVPFEAGVVDIIQNGLGIMGQAGPLIESWEDVNEFPWSEMPEKFFSKFSEHYDALREVIPDGMKAVGGIGYGVFEVTQDFVPFTELSLMSADNPSLFAQIFAHVGDLLVSLWNRLLERYGDLFAVCRSGDDLGFKTSTLLSPEMIRTHIIPQYRRIAGVIHNHRKPFLLHSCGHIFSVMDDIINSGVDAKHSNEDAIAPFRVWVDTYGDRIGNFGGFDLNVICLEDEKTIKEYVTEILKYCNGKPGIAVGSGNQIADYVPPEGFTAMVEAVRDFRKA